MQEKQLFEYAVIRLVPRVEREEFFNVGVILYCPAQKFLKAACGLDPQRARAFAPELNLPELEKHVRSFALVCAGGASAGAIGEMSARERFYWLTAPRSTVLQTSPVHTGLCSDAQTTLDNLFKNMVG